MKKKHSRDLINLFRVTEVGFYFNNFSQSLRFILLSGAI